MRERTFVGRIPRRKELEENEAIIVVSFCGVLIVSPAPDIKQFCHPSPNEQLHFPVLSFPLHGKRAIKKSVSPLVILYSVPHVG